MSSRIAGRAILIGVTITLLSACSRAVAQSVDSATPQTPTQQIKILRNQALLAINKHDSAELDQILNRILTLADTNHLGGDPSVLGSLAVMYAASSDPTKQLGYLELALRLATRDGGEDAIRKVCGLVAGMELPQVTAGQKGYPGLDEMEKRFPVCRNELERVRPAIAAVNGARQGDYSGMLAAEKQRSESTASSDQPVPDATGLAFMSLLSGDVTGARRYVLKMEDDPKNRETNTDLPGLPELRQVEINSGSGSGFGAASLAALYDLGFKQDDSELRRNALQMLLTMKDRELDVARSNISMLRSAQKLNQSSLATQMIAEYANSSDLWAEAMIDRGSVSNTEEQAGVVRMQALEQELRDLDEQKKADKIPPRSPRVADVQQVLQPDEALVEYAMIWWPQYHQSAKPPVDLKKASSELHYVAYILRHDGTIRGFDLGDIAVIHDAARKYRSLAESGASKQEVSSSAQALHRLLWEPLQPALAGVDTESGHVYVSPDADLALIPFDGLIDEQNRYLVQTWNISYLTSGRQLVEMLHWRQGEGKVVVFADHQAPNEHQENNSGPDVGHQATSQIRTGGLAREYPPLVATGLEAKAIAAALPDSTLLYTGPDATKQALKNMPAPKVLHLAVHGYFVDGDAPLPSNPNDFVVDKKKKYGFLRYGLILSNGKDGKPTDRILTSLEISMLNLDQTDLVVLSACDSGVGDTTPGDNVSGLRTAFQMAGAKAVISSLWTVDDVRGREFMADFYKRLAAGANQHNSINESLRQTKLSMIAQKREAYYWASFVLDGKDQVLRF